LNPRNLAAAGGTFGLLQTPAPVIPQLFHQHAITSRRDSNRSAEIPAQMRLVGEAAGMRDSAYRAGGFSDGCGCGAYTKPAKFLSDPGAIPSANAAGEIYRVHTGALGDTRN